MKYSTSIIFCKPGEAAKVIHIPKTQKVAPKVKELLDANECAVKRRQFVDDPEIVILGLKKDPTPNRALYNENGSVRTVITGAFILCAMKNKELEPLTTEQTSCYAQLFKKPQRFFIKNDRIIAMDYNP